MKITIFLLIFFVNIRSANSEESKPHIENEISAYETMNKKYRELLEVPSDEEDEKEEESSSENAGEGYKALKMHYTAVKEKFYEDFSDSERANADLFFVVKNLLDKQASETEILDQMKKFKTKYIRSTPHENKRHAVGKPRMEALRIYFENQLKNPHIKNRMFRGDDLMYRGLKPNGKIDMTLPEFHFYNVDQNPNFYHKVLRKESPLHDFSRNLYQELFGSRYLNVITEEQFYAWYNPYNPMDAREQIKIGLLNSLKGQPKEVIGTELKESDLEMDSTMRGNFPRRVTFNDLKMQNLMKSREDRESESAFEEIDDETELFTKSILKKSHSKMLKESGKSGESENMIFVDGVLDSDVQNYLPGSPLYPLLSQNKNTEYSTRKLFVKFVEFFDKSAETNKQASILLEDDEESDIETNLTTFSSLKDVDGSTESVKKLPLDFEIDSDDESLENLSTESHSIQSQIVSENLSTKSHSMESEKVCEISPIAEEEHEPQLEAYHGLKRESYQEGDDAKEEIEAIKSVMAGEIGPDSSIESSEKEEIEAIKSVMDGEIGPHSLIESSEKKEIEAIKSVMNGEIGPHSLIESSEKEQNKPDLQCPLVHTWKLSEFGVDTETDTLFENEHPGTNRTIVERTVRSDDFMNQKSDSEPISDEKFGPEHELYEDMTGKKSQQDSLRDPQDVSHILNEVGPSYISSDKQYQAYPTSQEKHVDSSSYHQYQTESVVNGRSSSSIHSQKMEKNPSEQMCDGEFILIQESPVKNKSNILFETEELLAPCHSSENQNLPVTDPKFEIAKSRYEFDPLASIHDEQNKSGLLVQKSLENKRFPPVEIIADFSFDSERPFFNNKFDKLSYSIQDKDKNIKMHTLFGNKESQKNDVNFSKTIQLEGRIGKDGNIRYYLPKMDDKSLHSKLMFKSNSGKNTIEVTNINCTLPPSPTEQDLDVNSSDVIQSTDSAPQTENHGTFTIEYEMRKEKDGKIKSVE